MNQDRRWWVLTPLLLACVVLLTRGVPDPKPSAERASAPSVSAVDADARSAPPAAVGDDAPPPPRYPAIGFRTPERLMEHFHKHGREFRARRPEDYLKLAQILRDRPRSGDVLSFIRNDAVTCKYDRSNGAFLAYDSDGTIRTFFRPKDGETYFERQKSRAHEAP